MKLFTSNCLVHKPLSFHEIVLPQKRNDIITNFSTSDYIFYNNIIIVCIFVNTLNETKQYISLVLSNLIHYLLMHKLNVCNNEPESRICDREFCEFQPRNQQVKRRHPGRRRRHTALTTSVLWLAEDPTWNYGTDPPSLPESVLTASEKERERGREGERGRERGREVD